MNPWISDTDQFIKAMHAERIRRACIVRDPESGALVTSHALLEPIARVIRADTRDYRDHQAIFMEVGLESGHLCAAFLHWTNRGQAAGGVRYWTYPSMEAFVRDGLRLSRGMGQKCALAGLWWGGGKGIIARRADSDYRDPDVRRRVFHDYGRFISGLRGAYITAEDVGTGPEDMARIFEKTRYMTCIPPSLGGSGNPSRLTAKGVVVAMEAALHHRELGTLAGKNVAFQGLGNVARFMITELLARNVAHIIGTDIDPEKLEEVEAQFPNAPITTRLVEPTDHSILGEDVTIVAPNAVGATLNPQTIPTIRAPIVCGAANNQLEASPRDARALKERQVLYVPDFLANRMGIVNCANEQYGSIEGDPHIDQHLSRDVASGVFQRSLEVFRRAEASGRTTAEEAEELADELALELHPMWGNRTGVLIRHLVTTGWADGPHT